MQYDAFLLQWETSLEKIQIQTLRMVHSAEKCFRAPRRWATFWALLYFATCAAKDRVASRPASKPVDRSVAINTVQS